MFVRCLYYSVKMLEMRSYFLLACQLAALGILVIWNNVFGLDWNMYERFWGWDIVSHMLGGLWVGLFVAWAASHPSRRIARMLGKNGGALFLRTLASFRKHTIFWCVMSAIVFGVIWELYELWAGLQYTTYPWPIEVEIIKDLVDDAIGGYAAGYFVNRSRR